MVQLQKSARKFLICLLWIALWQAAALAIHNSIILVGPADVARALLRLAAEAEFWNSILHSFGRIVLGFLAAFLAGTLLGSLAYAFPPVREFLEPLILAVKTIPVASFVILALIWAGSKNLAVLISFLVVFPILWVHTLAGLNSTDPLLLEMAQVFRVGLPRRIRLLYFPTLRPYLADSCRLALGMAWKAGVAAEIIGLPDHSIGEKLYLSKIYLETADLFAWTLVIIAVSAACEQLVLRILRGRATPGTSRDGS